MEVTYIKVFVDYLDAVEPLGDAERGRLFTALLQYARSGEAPQLNGNERFLFPMMRAQIDRDRAAMDEVSQARAEAGSKGGKSKQNKQMLAKQANASKSKQNKQMLANLSKSSKDKEEDKDKDKDNMRERSSEAAPREKRTRFSPPSLQEVQDYCAERGSSVDPEQFLDFYAANGWKQGSGKPIVDWRACVRTWERRDAQKQSSSQAKKNSFQNYDQRETDYDATLSEIWEKQYGGEP